ncbi:IS110 family transposase [Candidatus Pollutiaquabacter sp.]|uniref:IS110 family transposase n=1 Tax=Candidatus Pollutiaquabacter sp. TaxID=3416354 RepID=UPI003C89AB49|nr:transposase [Bacteroidota bacterium]
MKFEHIIGIDVSKATVDFCILGEVRSDGTLENSPKKLQLFFKSLKLDPRKTLVCLEHTGVYNIHLVEVLCKLGFHVWLESALRIKGQSVWSAGKVIRLMQAESQSMPSFIRNKQISGFRLEKSSNP